MKPRVVILAKGGESLDYTFNYLKDSVKIEAIVVEQPMSRKKMLQYRLKKLGWFTVFGQLLFIGFSKILSRLSETRKRELVSELKLDTTPIPIEKITQVSSVNTKACRSVLKKAKHADFVFVIGTRIIGKKTLSSISIPFVNVHAGITPRYRGVHGGYWALANRDKENCGVTLHYVDTGVDTGEIIGQKIITPTKQDNFITYPLIQHIAGLDLLLEKLDFIINREDGFSRDDLNSKQWFHPTLWEYFWNMFTKSVK